MRASGAFRRIGRGRRLETAVPQKPSGGGAVLRLQHEDLEAQGGMESHLAVVRDDLAAGDLLDSPLEPARDGLLEVEPHLADQILLAILDERVLHRGEQVLQHGEDVVVQHVRLRLRRPTAVALAVDADDLIRDLGEDLTFHAHDGTICGRQAGWGLRRLPQGLDLAPGREPLQRLRLELTYALRGQPQLAAGLAERLGIDRAVDPVAQLDDVPLGLRQLLDRPPQRLLPQTHLDLFVRRALAALEQLAERRLALLADRSVEARHGARRSPHLLDLLGRQLGRAGDLLDRRIATQLGAQLALDARDLALPLADVDGDADGARAVREPALDGLPDPERGVGRELVALAPVELLGGAD